MRWYNDAGSDTSDCVGERETFVRLTLQKQAAARQRGEYLEARDTLQRAVTVDMAQWEPSERVALEAELAVLIVEQHLSLVTELLRNEAIGTAALQSTAATFALEATTLKARLDRQAGGDELAQMLGRVPRVQAIVERILSSSASGDGMEQEQGQEVFSIVHIFSSWSDAGLRWNNGALVRVRRALEGRVAVISVRRPLGSASETHIHSGGGSGRVSE